VIAIQNMGAELSYKGEQMEKCPVSLALREWTQTVRTLESVLMFE